MGKCKPGETGEPLQGKDCVLRLGLEQSDYDSIGANQFELSTSEKEEDWKRISVWEASLTTVEQAVKFVGNPKRKLLLRLKVSAIRSLTFNADQLLNVKWDRLPDCVDDKGEKIAGSTDGCEGHCALDGLYPSNKKLRRKIRKRLAELAMKSDWQVLT